LLEPAKISLHTTTPKKGRNKKGKKEKQRNNNTGSNNLGLLMKIPE
jgi:hypothetical protein